MLKTVGLALGTFILVFTLCVPLTHALPFPQVLDEYNSLFFENVEVLIDRDGDGMVSVGDTFWGVLNVQNVKAPVDVSGQFGPNIWMQGGAMGPPAEITGYFATDVVNILPVGHPDNPYGEALIEMGPVAGDPNNILSPGEVIRIFEDSANNFNNSTQALGLLTATDGTHIWSLGLGPSTDGDSSGGYYYSLTPVTPPGSGDVGIAYAGLNFMQPNGDLFDVVNDPNDDWSTWDFVNHQASGNGLDVEIWFNSEIFQVKPITDTVYFHFGSNDPAVYKPVEEVVPGQCRMTGGNVTVNWHYILGTYAEVKKNLPQGGKKFYTVGGQVGAPKANDPSFGEWTHTQHAGFEGSFTFHAGTNSAPVTEISSIACDDPGWCVQARCAPFKQIFWDGIGSFKNEKGFNAVFTCDVIPGETLHYFRAHVGDFGEPGNSGKQKNEAKCEWASGGPNIADVVFIDAVPDDKFGDKGGQECDECPDYYEIEIHCTTDPASPVIYSVGDFIDGGNFQIHPEVGQQCPY